MQLSGPLIRPREWKEREGERGLSINKVCGTNSLVSHVPETERGSHFKIWNSIWLTFNMDESSFVLDSKFVFKYLSCTFQLKLTIPFLAESRDAQMRRPQRLNGGKILFAICFPLPPFWARIRQLGGFCSRRNFFSQKKARGGLQQFSTIIICHSKSGGNIFLLRNYVNEGRGGREMNKN